MKTLTWLWFNIRRKGTRYQPLTPSTSVLQKYDRKTGRWVNVNRPEKKAIKL